MDTEVASPLRRKHQNEISTGIGAPRPLAVFSPYVCQFYNFWKGSMNKFA